MPGMTVVQARAIAPDIVVHAVDSGLLEKARERILRVLRTISPAVETDREADGEAGACALFFVDFRGLARHYPTTIGRKEDHQTKAGEEAFLEALYHSIRELGYQARAGLAGGRFAALAAAVCHDRPTSVPPGREKDHLAPLPLDILPMSSRLGERLAPLGLRTIGQFASLCPASVEIRYGAEGVALHRLARGIDLTPPPSSTEPLEPHTQIDLEHGIDKIPVLLAHITPALDDLLETTRQSARAAAALLIELSLSGAESIRFTVRPARPTTEAAVLVRLIDLECRKLVLAGPVVGATLTISEHAGRPAEQTRLFASHRVERRRFDLALAELQKLLGKSAVGYPMVKNMPRPEESFAILPPGSKTPSRPTVAPLHHAPHAAPSRPPSSDLPPRRNAAFPVGFRLCNPPRSIDVLLEDCKIKAFVLDGTRLRVRARFGPERREGSWWDHPFARDYYQVITQGAGLFWIYQDRLANRWFLGGLFD